MSDIYGIVLPVEAQPANPPARDLAIIPVLPADLERAAPTNDAAAAVDVVPAIVQLVVGQPRPMVARWVLEDDAMVVVANGDDPVAVLPQLAVGPIAFAVRLQGQDGGPTLVNAGPQVASPHVFACLMRQAIVAVHPQDSCSTGAVLGGLGQQGDPVFALFDPGVDEG